MSLPITASYDSRRLRQPSLMLSAFLLLPCAVLAVEDLKPIAIRGTPPFRAEIAVDTDYAAKADTGYPASRSDTSLWVHQVQALYFPEVKGNLHLRVGGSWQRWTIDTDQPEPVPGKLQAVNGVIGMDHRVNARWDVRLEMRPGLYGDLSDVHGGTFNVPVIGGASYKANDRLLLLGGFMIDPRGDIPFFPFIGARWQFAPRWTLEFIAPRPRVKYQVNESLALYTGAEIRGGSFRVARDYGTRVGDPRLNDDILSITEYRVGAGAEWKITPVMFLDLAAGYMIERRLHYKDADVNQYSGGAPVVHASLRYRFAR